MKTWERISVSTHAYVFAVVSGNNYLGGVALGEGALGVNHVVTAATVS